MIDQWFSIADLVIQPNKISSQSGVTALSISFEKKIVTTGTGGIGEVINSNNGYICESNVDSMTKTINYALRDKNFNFDNKKNLLEVQIREQQSNDEENVRKIKKFYEAENYHQDYKIKNPNNPYIWNVSVPRIEKFKSNYTDLLKKE